MSQQEVDEHDCDVGLELDLVGVAPNEANELGDRQAFKGGHLAIGATRREVRGAAQVEGVQHVAL